MLQVRDHDTDLGTLQADLVRQRLCPELMSCLDGQSLTSARAQNWRICAAKIMPPQGSLSDEQSAFRVLTI